jgi:hypothetical protein
MVRQEEATPMRRVSTALGMVLWLLLAFAAPAGAAGLTGGCTLEVRSFGPDGRTVLDEGAAPGAEGSQDDPLDVAWHGRVDFRFTTGSTVFQDNEWRIFAAGIPVAILEGSDDNPMDLDESGDVVVGQSFSDALRVVGLVNVTGYLEGNSGTARCDGDGWVRLVGDPVGTIPWFLFLALLALGLLFLVATPYTIEWEEGGYSPMRGGPVRPEGT